MAENKNDRLVWVDCEMTGLLPESDVLVEIAAIVTDGQLNELDSGISIVICPPELSILDTMDEIVVKMHTSSGLLEEIPSGVSVDVAEQAVLDYVKLHAPEARKAPLAGSSVYVDRGFIAKYMPDLDAHLHYRLIDVSSIKELARRWYPRAYYNAPSKTGNHRALADIRESIAELRYYREAVMVDQPGPSTDDARQIATRHAVDHEGALEQAQGPS